MYPWRRQDVQTTLEASLEKDVARKGWQRKQLGPIPPLAGDRVEWEQGLKIAVTNARGLFQLTLASVSVCYLRRIEPADRFSDILERIIDGQYHGVDKS